MDRHEEDQKKWKLWTCEGILGRNGVSGEKGEYKGESENKVSISKGVR